MSLNLLKMAGAVGAFAEDLDALLSAKHQDLKTALLAYLSGEDSYAEFMTCVNFYEFRKQVEEKAHTQNPRLQALRDRKYG